MRSDRILAVNRTSARWLQVIAIASFLATAAVWSAPSQSKAVTLIRVPGNGIQPRIAMDNRGSVHMVYLQGDPGGGDLYYTRWDARQGTFIRPIRVNSQPHSAIAMGTIRGGQIAVGKNGRVHIVWNGAIGVRPEGHHAGAGSPGRHDGRGAHDESPLLYTRSNDGATGFDAQRNVMKITSVLDGGGTVAADRAGNVYVAWHASSHGDPAGEEGRRVWVARSTDDGRTFSREEPASSRDAGACACCSTHAFADDRGTLYILFRSAEKKINRDMVLLVSKEGGKRFSSARIDPWPINT